MAWSRVAALLAVSRDHRPDCAQLVITIIVNNEGFPFSYEIFDGGRTDVSTTETILRMVERKYDKARRIWVFDRGIVPPAGTTRQGATDGGIPRLRIMGYDSNIS